MVLGIASQAAIPERNGNIRNGVIRTGAALSRILTIDSPESLLRKCYNENIGSRLFSDSCLELIEQLQQKTGLMTVESDIQMQAERIDPLLRKSKNQERLEMLAKLNLSRPKRSMPSRPFVPLFPRTGIRTIWETSCRWLKRSGLLMKAISKRPDHESSPARFPEVLA